MEDGLEMAFESLQGFQKADSICFNKSDDINPFVSSKLSLNQDTLDDITCLYKNVTQYILR
jgi:hypothetical protein